MGHALVYGAVRLRRRRDGLVTTEHDHYATHESLRLRAARDRLDVRRIRLYDDPAQPTADSIVTAVRSGITDRTGVLVLIWVHSGTGVKLPLRTSQSQSPATAVTACSSVVDGVHALGVEDEPIRIETVDVLHRHLGRRAGRRRGDRRDQRALTHRTQVFVR